MSNKTNHFPLSTGILRSSHASMTVRMVATTVKRMYAATMIAMLGMLLPISAWAQVPVALSPVPKLQWLDNNGKPLASGCIYTYATGTTTPQATYTDSTGSTPNANPIILDAGGYTPPGGMWLQALTYRIQLWSKGAGGIVGSNCNSGTQIYQLDGISEQGLLALTKSVLLNPAGGATQTVTGPLQATVLQQTTTAVSTGIEPDHLAPTGTFQTATNQPGWSITNPANASQNYTVPDPATPTAAFILAPNQTTNTLDCTQTGITCKRTASFYFGGGSCSGTTATLGWDTFSTNNPLAFCLTGANTQKAVMGLPSAYAHVQQNTGTSSAAGTITTTYPNATIGGNGDMLVLSVAFNATTTITGCTDGTNAYSQAKHVANGALSLDIWVFHNATTKPAGTTLTCTFSAAASGALKWHEYIAPNPTSTDVSASNTGTSTTASTGTTASTAQATELVFAAAGDLAAPTLVPAGAGYADHTVVNNSTTVQVDDAGIIQQAIATQSTTFTLGTSQAWAAAIVAFKAANGSAAVAQRTIVLPSFFNASQAVNSIIEWSSPLVAIGTSNVMLGGQVACTGQGTTDDPTFNTVTSLSSAAGQSAANTTAQVTLSGLTITGCVAGNILHYQISRQRYNASDIYEGFANVYGDLLTVGINQ